MTSKEWIELFFSEAFEKQINELILEDIDYEIPRESILRYVHHVIDVPYKDYLDYVGNLEPVPYDKFDIPYFEKYEYCENVLIDYLISQDNIGCTEEEIGKYLADREWKIKGSTTFYGSKHLHSAKILGVVYEFYNHWYLNCIGYVYGTLNNRQRASLLARTILRSPFFRKLLYNIKTPIIYFENYMNMFSDRFVKKHLKSILFFSEICVKEAQECNIVLTIKSTSTKYKTIGDILNVDRIIPNNASKALRLYFKELRGFPILSEYEIRRIFKDYKNGNKKSLSLIVKASQLTVLRIALSYKFAPLEDIIQEGNIGVMNAINSFDSERVKSYYGFLSFWVKRIIQSFRLSYPYLIHFPLSKLKLLYQFEIRVLEFLQENEFMPSVCDLDINNDGDYETIEFLIQLFDSPNNFVQLCDVMDCFESDTVQIDIFQEAEYNSYYVKVLLNSLDNRKEGILRLYYGIGSEAETLSCIGDKFKLTRERVRQLVESAIRKLQKIIQNNEVFDEISLTTTPHQIVNVLNDANIGDYVELPEQKQIGKVINIHMVNQERIFYVMGVEDRKVLKMTKDGTILSDNLKRNQAKTGTITSERIAFLKSLYGSDNKNERNTTTQDKSKNHITKETKQKKQEINVPIANTLPDTVKVGDRILYDKRCATVVEKRSVDGFSRLIIEYDNGTFDNVQDDTERYKIINNYS